MSAEVEVEVGDQIVPSLYTCSQKKSDKFEENGDNFAKTSVSTMLIT